MNALTQELVELLSLEKLEENIFRGISRNLVGKRVFGGQVLGAGTTRRVLYHRPSSTFITCLFSVWRGCQCTDYL